MLFTYHKYRKSLDSTIPLDAHGNPIVLDEDDGLDSYVELEQTDRMEASSMLRATSDVVSNIHTAEVHTWADILFTRIPNHYTPTVKACSRVRPRAKKTPKSTRVYVPRKSNTGPRSQVMRPHHLRCGDRKSSGRIFRSVEAMLGECSLIAE